MSTNLRMMAVWLLGAALASASVFAAAPGHGGGRAAGGGRGAGGHASGGGRGGGAHVSAGARGGGGQTGGMNRAGGAGHAGGMSRAGSAGQAGSSAARAGGSVRSAPRVESHAAPQAGFRAAPRSDSRAPGGGVATTPRGEFRTAPGGQGRAAPGGSPGTAHRPESWNRDWTRHHGSLNSHPNAARPGDWRHPAEHRAHAGWHHPGHWDHVWWPGHGFWWGGAWRLGSYWWPGYLWARPWWTGYYGYYGRGYLRSGYNSGYSSGDYGYGDATNGAVSYAAAATPVESTAPVAPETQYAAADLYQRALTAFQQGDFRNALRWAAHAAVDNPEDAGLHVLLSLAMFAQGDFQGAAIEAHGLAANGKIPDWEMVYGLYGALEPYETHLRALEKFVAENPSAAEGRFLLGFHYMMAGHRKAAQDEFLEALKAVPEDQLSAELLANVGGKVPADIVRRQSQSPPPQGTPTARPPAPPRATPKQSPEPAIPPVPETQRLF